MLHDQTCYLVHRAYRCTKLECAYMGLRYNADLRCFGVADKVAKHMELYELFHLCNCHPVCGLNLGRSGLFRYHGSVNWGDQNGRGLIAFM